MSLSKFYKRCGELAGRINTLPTVKLLLVLIAFFFLWRFLTIEFIERSGDAVWKWNFLRYYVNFGDWHPPYPDHHQGRWAITVPVLALMKLFGDTPWVYYIYPLTMALGVSTLLFFIVKELRSKAAGAAAFLLAMFFPLTVRESYQFLPMLPAAFYALFAGFLLVRHMKTASLQPVFWAGVLVAVSYGCKFTSLYWALAFALALSLWPAKGKGLFRVWKFHCTPAVLLFSAGVVAVLVLETVLLNHFFDVTYGRAEVILGSHLHDRPAPQYMGLLKYLVSFYRPMEMSGKYFDFLPQVILFLVALFSGVFWLIRGNREQKAIAFSFLAVYLLHSYMVYKIFPFLHPEKSHGRYFLVLAVFGMVLFAGCWKESGEFLLRLTRGGKALYTIRTVLLLLMLTLFCIRFVNIWTHDNHIFTLVGAHRNMAKARDEKLPVLSRVRSVERALEGNMADGDHKNGALYLIVWGPAEELPARKCQPFLVRNSENGKYYELIMNADEMRFDVPAEVILVEGPKSESVRGVFTKEGGDPHRNTPPGKKPKVRSEPLT